MAIRQARSQESKRLDAAAAKAEEAHGVGEWLDDEHTIERFNDYQYNTSDMKNDHICGMNNVSDSESDGGYGYNLFCGYGNRNYGYQARDNLIAGNTNTNRGGQNLIVGMSNTNSGSKNIIAGQNNNGSASDNVISGQYNTVSAARNIVNGQRNSVTNTDNIVNGNDNTVNGYQNIVNGNSNSAGVSRCLMIGQNHSGSGGDMAIIGGNGAVVSWRYLLMIGNSGNIFTVDYQGNVEAAGQYGTIGADYAEFFEWEDGNPGGEYRRGMLVALDGDKIIPAQGDDFIGIISDNPAVLGNMTPDKLSDPKYAPVGLIGRLVVRDNGTCRPNGYVSARDGIAVASIRKTPARVLRRIDETHVEVLLK